MRPGYYPAVLCGFLILTLTGLASACYGERAEEAQSFHPESVVELPLLAQEEDQETCREQTARVFVFDDGSDVILATYRDPSFREGVEAFFGDLIGYTDIAAVILSNAAAHDIPPALAFALCAEESAYNPRAINFNRNDTIDRGLFQLNSASFPDLRVEDFYDLGINAWHGLGHLRWCLNIAGTEVAGLAMYNAGSNRVRSSGAPKSTLDYISRILKRQRRIEELFIAEYTFTTPVEVPEIEDEIIEEIEEAEEEKEEKAPFRLSLLKPLGR